MKKICYILLTGLSLALLVAGCTSGSTGYLETIDHAHIFPDYTDITIPPNIAPLNFIIREEQTACRVTIQGKRSALTLKGKEAIRIPMKKWKQLLSESGNSKLTVTISVKKGKEWIQYRPFNWHVAKDPIDPYLVYRLIEPTYANWNQMGIYQRCLENFTESAVIQNEMTNGNCMNCHSFCMQDEKNMVFHMRKTNAGTYLIRDGKITRLNTTTPYTASFFVYPAWHPSGQLIAFTVNKTHQSFYMADNKRSEIYDSASDILFYDIAGNEIFTTPLLTSENVLETYPAFSPDGKKLFFCTAPVQENIPEDANRIKYSLCSIDFDPEKQSFEEKADTLVSAYKVNKSVVFPRISPDGKYLLFSMLESGCFPCWSRDADLYVYSFEKNDFYPLEAANSTSSEGYATWSSNSRWMIVSSRRLDDGFTRPFIVYMDENGKATKAFLLPQKNPDIYMHSLKSFNLPELVKNKIQVDPSRIQAVAQGDELLQVNVRGKEKITLQKEQSGTNDNHIN